MEFIKKFQCQHCHGIVETEFADDYVICGHCEAACQVPKEFGPGVVIDDFVIAKLLGEGGMGHVYLAHQFSLDRKVALKILKEDFLKDPKFKDEFIYEARSVACLNHPHIIQAYKVGEEYGIVFFAMEYVEGRNLQDILKEDGAITEKLALSVAMEIVSALGYAWNLRKLVHRDIKPENIMISTDGAAKLMDLGLSLRDGDDKDDGDTISGTPQYISPEQIVGNEMDIRGDFYCLGATLYHLVSGSLPFEGSLQEIIKQHLSAQPKPLKELAPHLNLYFVKIIHKMLSKSPEDRYDNADTLLIALKKDMQLLIDEEHGKKHFKVTTQTNIKTSTNSTELIQRKKKMDPLVIASIAMLGILLGGFFVIRLLVTAGSSTALAEQNKQVNIAASGSGSQLLVQNQSRGDDVIPQQGLYFSYYHIKMNQANKLVNRLLTKLGETEYFSAEPKGDRKDYYLTRYEGYINLPYSETYLFYLKADDYISLYIDNKKIGSSGSQGGRFTSTFSKGSYPIKVEYRQHTLANSMSIELESISINKTKLPKEWLTKSSKTLDLKYDDAKPGLDYILYKDSDYITSIANKTPDKRGSTSGLKDLLDQERGAYVACFRGLVNLPKAGRYKIYLNADTRAFFYLNDILIMDASSNDSGEAVKEINFTSKINKIEFEYLHKRKGKKLTFEIEGEGMPRQEVPEEWYFKDESGNFSALRNKAPASKPSESPKTSDGNTGLNYNYYETTLKNNVEDILKEEVKGTGEADRLNYKRGRKDEFYGLYFYGYINIPESEDYTFFIDADDQALLKINDKEVARDTAVAGEGEGRVGLNKGSHKVEIFYYQVTGNRKFSLNVQSKNIAKQKIPDSWFSKNKID